MSCGLARDRLWAFVHDECADQAESQEIAAHVRTCAACGSSVQEMKALVANLAALGEETQRLDGPPDSSAPTEAPLPEHVGGYRILRKLGEGGMGVVFEAEQQNPRRRVALKVVRAAHFADDFSLKLFRREAQTLGRLTHPGIAAIYEAGVADGCHFFAMELVDGRPLSEFVAGSAGGRGPLSLAERARLFLRVCEALAYAHQRGVLHRDLKPTNIIVTPDGQPKILDFGLARITGGDAQVTQVSEGGRIMGTLPYMSPEQVSGAIDTLDVRSDVYALGVLLYELLTGSVPFLTLGRPMHTVVRDICETPPRPPLTWNPRVPADLNTICLKALEKPPERRYQTAAELADDLTRYLERRPILARPASVFYRAQRFMARNALAVTLLTTLFVVILGAAIGLGLQSRRIAAERDVARRELAKFEQTTRVLIEGIKAPNPWERGSKDTTVLEVLDAVAARIERELADQPLVAAALRHTLGQTYRAFSEYDKALGNLDFAVQTRAELLGESDPETLDALDDRGEAFYEAGRLDEAERDLRAALEQRRRVLPAADARVSESLNSVGLLALQRGDFDEARTLLEDALRRRAALATGLENAPAADPRLREDAFNALAQTHNNLGVLLRRQAEQVKTAGRTAEAATLFEQAAPHFERALALRRQWLGEQHPETAKQHNNLANLMADMGRTAEAEASYLAALRILLDALGESHRFTAQAHYNLASLRFEAGRYNEARPHAQQALETQLQILGADHALTRRTAELLERIAATSQPAAP